MSRLFICYSRIDGSDVADQLYEELLRARDLPPPWMDRRDLPLAEDWCWEIQEAITGCEAVLFLMTRDSATSRQCAVEWRHAAD